ncbi:hypothetical protein M407DRAFT_53320, partial [Tulasnella calospora MUT 4182]
VNLQHDCQRSGCMDSKTRPAVQELMETQYLESQVDHMATGLFIVNTNSLHNYRAIRTVVP